MRRKPFAYLSALSLLLCAAVCVLWVRSYFVADCVQRHRGRFLTRVDLACGGVRLEHFDGAGIPSFGAFAGADSWEHDTYRPERLERPGPVNGDVIRASGCGLQLYHGLPPVRPISGKNWAYPGWGAVVPFWAIALACLAPPLFGWRSRRRYHWLVRAGRCAACAYDLRATPGRCPECGAVATTPPQTAA
jgi:hypothetical protein